MLNNWFNADDFALIARRIREGDLRRILGRVFGGCQNRIETAWRKSEIPPTNWWDIPEVVERWNLKITGSPEKDFNQYVTELYLRDKVDLTAVSLGCGTGLREIRWAKTGKFKQITGYDLSSPRIEMARKLAASSRFSHVLQFEVADVFTTGTDKTYDAVIVEGSLHHFSPLETILERIQHLLKDDGLLLVNEFVGPTQFQWTDRQLTEINQIIANLPDCLKTKWDGESIKKRVTRPSRLRIRYGDPSEAIESGRIRPLLETMFRPLDIKAYGGTILHMLFHEIAHNFCSDDPEAKRWLQTCFDTEDALIESNILTSDFIVGVYRKKLS